MELSINTIPFNEQQLIARFVNYWTNQSYIGNETWLSNWVCNKQKLFKLFGEQLIIKEPIEFSESEDKLINNMYNALYYPKKEVSMSWREFTSKIAEMGFVYFTNNGHPTEDNHNFKQLREFLFCENLGDSLFYVKNNFGKAMPEGQDHISLLLENGKKMKITSTEKCFKVLKKLLDLFYASKWFNEEQAMYDTYGDIPNKEEMYKCLEEYRLIQSQVLNIKKAKGTLCLSIHPLDYLTMSMNNCNWRSCMSWDEGEYHSGTVEMMNSPWVIVAYITNDNEKYYPLENNDDDEAWSNKRWRELFIVNEDLISTVKAYPYRHEAIEDIIVDKLKKLAKDNWGFDYYNAFVISEDEYFCHPANLDVCNYYFTTDRMYNDTPCGVRVWWNTDHKAAQKKTYEYNYSGVALCTCCGDYMYQTGEGDEEYVTCDSCRGSLRCSECGCRYDEDDGYWYDGQFYCPDCYHSLFWECQTCGEEIKSNQDSGVEILFRTAYDEGRRRRDEYILMCSECFEYAKQYFVNIPYSKVNNGGMSNDKIWVIKSEVLHDKNKMKELWEFDRRFKLINSYWRVDTGYFDFEAREENQSNDEIPFVSFR